MWWQLVYSTFASVILNIALCLVELSYIKNNEKKICVIYTL